MIVKSRIIPPHSHPFKDFPYYILHIRLSYQDFNHFIQLIIALQVTGSSVVNSGVWMKAISRDFFDDPTFL